MPNFTNYKDMIGAKFKNGSRDSYVLPRPFVTVG